MTIQRVKLNTSLSTFARLGTFFLIVSALSLAREVFVPLALAILFSFLLNPISVWLERRRLGRVPAVVMAVLLLFALLGGTLYVIGSELTTLAQDTQRYKTEIIRKVRGIAGSGSGLGDQLESMKDELSDALKGEKPDGREGEPEDEGNPSSSGESGDSGPDDWKQRDPFGSQMIAGESPDSPIFTKEVAPSSSPILAYATSLGLLAGPLGTGSLVLVFTFFIMIYREDLRDRIIKVVSRGQYVTTTRAIGEASERISKYLVAQTIVNGSYGMVISFGLWLIGETMGGEIGFPNYLLWGFMCTLLRFVPYVGPVVAGAFPVLVSLAVFPGFSVFIAVLVLIGTVELLSNNLMEPWLYGSSTGMSAMAVILAAVFWGWLWGPIGLLLATPLTVCLVVMGKHIPQFRIFTTLLGENVALPIPVQLYQRLLARDMVGARLLADKQLEIHNAETFLDSALMPTLRRIRKDRESQRLSSSDERELVSGSHELVDYLQSVIPRTASDDVDESSESQSDDASHQSPPCRKLVYGVPAHHASEEAALHALSTVFDVQEVEFRHETTRALAKAIIARIDAENPSVVVIALMPPGGLVQAEFLCKQLRDAFEDQKIVVAYFGKTSRFDQLLVRLRKSGASYLTTSIEQTRLQVESLLTESDAP